jgi:ribosome-associated protein
MDITPTTHIPEEELVFAFARSGGPGGQNVNKVASKAVLRWDLAANATLPPDVKERLCAQQANRITTEGELVLQSQRFRDQAKNVEDCREKLRELVLLAFRVPKPRKKTKPSRAARERRLLAKKQQAQRKSRRRKPAEE